MSEPTDQLAKAIAGLQAHCGGVKKTGKNPHFRSEFVTLADAWAVVRSALPGLGLAIAQLPVTDLPNGLAGVETRVMHESGQSMTSQLLLPIGQKATAQSVGSAITYARRYSLLAICGVADDDDDGHAASQGAQQSRSSGAHGPNAARTGNQSSRGKKTQPAPLRPEIVSLLDKVREQDPAEADSMAGYMAAARNSDQAQDDIHAAATAFLAKPMQAALGVADEELPF